MSLSRLGLFKRKEIYLPTLRGWLTLAALLVVFFALYTNYIHSFLAISEDVDGEVLVVEGWLTDAELKQLSKTVNLKDYDKIVTTGGTFLKGGALRTYKTSAGLVAATLRSMELVDSTNITALPNPSTKKDRTYASAVVLSEWLKQNSLDDKRVTVVSIGVHARRSQLLFQRALGDHYQVGVISLLNENYNNSKWWCSSVGLKTVIGESIGYFYVLFFFHPST